LSTTLLAVSSAADRRFASSYLKTLRDLFGAANTVTRMRTSDDPVTTILAEAEGDYDLLVVGAPTMSDSSEYLFGPTIDDLVRLARCPTLVVRGWDVPDGWSPRRIVVPTNGTAAAVNAANLALTLSDYDTDLIAVHVVTPSLVGASEREDLGEDITAEFEKVGHMFDQQVTTSVRQSSRVEIGIMEEIERAGADLLVLGTNVRAGTTRLHLGPRVEYLAHHAPCPVLILNT
jgi:nucleotide-binding universal stress UspA family protein